MIKYSPKIFYQLQLSGPADNISSLKLRRQIDIKIKEIITGLIDDLLFNMNISVICGNHLFSYMTMNQLLDLRVIVICIYSLTSVMFRQK